LGQIDMTSSKSLDKHRVDEVIAWLRRKGSRKVRDGMARFAIPSDHAFGVPVGVMRAQSKKLGKDHALAVQLWEAEWYEARMMTAFLAQPELLSSAQMDRWCRQFDNWAVCDHLCFHLFDRSPLAMRKIVQWSKRKPEFERRAAFALLASVALHDRTATDEQFLKMLPLIEKAASDERNFVKKGVSWALRSVGGRSKLLHAAALATAKRLIESGNSAAVWIGRDAVRDLSSAATRKRLASR